MSVSDPGVPTVDWASAEVLLDRAAAMGASHAEIRGMAVDSRILSTSDGEVEASGRSREQGTAVRVLVGGCWGFAASDSTTSTEDLVVRAVEMARASTALVRTPVTLAPEPVHIGSWWGPCEIDPISVPEAEVREFLLERETHMAAHPVVTHTTSSFTGVRESTWLATSAGTRIAQQRCRVAADWTVLGTHDEVLIDEMSTVGPPTSGGWEMIRDGRHWDFTAECAELPDQLAEKLRAPSVEPGSATVVLDPTNLWLTIHESVGHATELDRALGYEANYAGTSFATPEALGSLRYGSALMHVTGDRQTPYGLATVGWDDEGVAAQQWDLVRDGVLVGFQLDRSMAGALGLPRSNGCAYADSPVHAPVQRMPNVSLQPGREDQTTGDLIAGVTDGYYIVGDRSWSIDMQRYNFQFTGQRFYRIRHGRLAGQVRDLAYQSRTPDFWAGLVAIGGPRTYLLGGALNCGKAQPGQVAAVSHGCPTAVFESVNILNAATVGGL